MSDKVPSTEKPTISNALIKRDWLFRKRLVWESPVDRKVACDSLRRSIYYRVGRGTFSVPRYGRIDCRDGRLLSISTYYLPTLASRFDVFIDARWRRQSRTSLSIYFNHLRSCPGFMAIAYARSGRKTTLATLHCGLAILDEIAILLDDRAIVFEATNSRLNENAMKYFGFTRHVPHLKGSHYIRRLS